MPGPKKNKRKSQSKRTPSVSIRQVVDKYDRLIKRYNQLANKLTSANRYLIAAHAKLTDLRERMRIVVLETEDPAGRIALPTTLELANEVIEALTELLDPLDIAMEVDKSEEEIQAGAEKLAAEMRESREPINEHPAPLRDDGHRYGGQRVSNPGQKYK